MINNKLLPEVIKSKQQGTITPELQEMLFEIVDTVANKPQHKNNPLRDDMIQHALAEIWRFGIQHFDPCKSSNPHAWFVTITVGSFLNVISKERQQRNLNS